MSNDASRARTVGRWQSMRGGAAAGRSMAIWAALLVLAAIAFGPLAAAAHADGGPVQLAALSDPAATGGDEFGHAVAISANGADALVGAYDTSSQAGATYLYTSSAGSWSSMPAVTFTDPGGGADHFGFAVALSPDGTTAFIAADHATVNSSAEAGVVYVYQESGGTWPTTPTAVLQDPGGAANDIFGVAMKLSPDGSTLVVGAAQTTVNSVSDAGAAYVYQESGGTWPTTPTATFTDPGTGGDRFGYAVGISDNSKGDATVVVGAFETDSEAGAIYLYDSSGGTWSTTPEATFADPANQSGDWFGRMVSIDAAGTTVIAGAEDTNENGVGGAGATYSYTLSGGTWSGPQQTFTDPSGNPSGDAAGFGYPSLAPDDGTLVIGAPDETVGGNADAGEVYLYQAGSSGYNETASIPDPTGGSSSTTDHFGVQAAQTTDGDIGIIGAAASVGVDSTDDGTAYIYDLEPMSVTSFYPTSGFPGGTTTIYGSNLSQVTSVEIDGTPATILTQSDSAIEVLVPTTTNGAITVTDAEGQTASSSQFFLVNNTYISGTPTENCTRAGSDIFGGGCAREVSCHTATTCTAVGETNDSSAGEGAPLISQLSDGTWQSLQAPVPANEFGGSPGAVLSSVSCPSTTLCVAVGAYVGPTGGWDPLIEKLAKGVWTATEGPLVNSPDGGLSYVSCVSGSSCVAVGWSTTSSSANSDPQIDTLSGGKWTGIQAPLPANALGGGTAEFYDLSCGSTNTCAAVGTYVIENDNNQYPVGLIDTLSGGSWTATQAPVPASAGGALAGATVSGVSCPSATLCVAAGDFGLPEQSGGIQEGMIETYSGGTWSETTTPLPADADSTTDAELNAVSCAHATTRCEAAGWYFNSSAQQGLIESLSNGALTPTKAPLPADGSTGAQLNTISCGSSTQCAAGGYGMGDPNGTPGLLETLSGGSWRPIEAPEPSQETSVSANIDGVGCVVGGTTCVAIGSEYSGATYSMLDTLSGGSWSSIEPPQAPPPASTTTVASVSPTQVEQGQAPTYTASVSSAGGAPTGEVTFYAGSQALCTVAIKSGTATCTTAKAPIGTDTVTASYAGTLQFDASTGTTTLTVVKR